jgi:hypothetical protein
MIYGAGAGLSPSTSDSFCRYHSINAPSPFSSYQKDKPAKPETIKTKKIIFGYRESLKGRYFHSLFIVSRNLKYSAFFIVCCHEGNCRAVRIVCNLYGTGLNILPLREETRDLNCYKLFENRVVRVYCCHLI